MGLSEARHSRTLQKQSPLYVRASLTDEPLLLLDPNALSPYGSVAFAQWSASPDGRFLAYGLAQGGADWQTIRVREIATGADLLDTIEWFRFSDLLDPGRQGVLLRALP